AENDFELLDGEGDFSDQEERLFQRRVDALIEIERRGGFLNLVEFWRAIESPSVAGIAAAAALGPSYDERILPQFLENGEEKDELFARGFVHARFYRQGWQWADGFNFSTWSNDSKAAFYAVLPFIDDVWTRVSKMLDGAEGAYWERSRHLPPKGKTTNIDYALDRLIEHGRPDAALYCLWSLSRDGQPLPQLALRALEAHSSAHQIHAHAVREIFKSLQANPDVDEELLARMEVKFLRVLDRFGGAKPFTLHCHLAERPEFFCYVIRLIYRSKNEVADDDDGEIVEYQPQPEGPDAAIAGNAYRLLMEWDRPPGRTREGGFNVDSLKEWVDTVRRDTVASGHWDMASHQIGEVLLYAPKDENGLWIDPVCELLNSRQDPEYRRGLSIRIYNSRGVYGFSGGKAEIEIAENWERIAAHAEAKGYGRLGTTLRDLGQSYRDDAKRMVAERRHDFD
ncbi:MAG: hypothetical protein ACFB21_12285, partial [Opitutales bacterium]